MVQGCANERKSIVEPSLNDTMAKILMNPALLGLRGQIGRLVFKHYHHGMVVSRHPDMSRVKPSAAQRAQRKKMKEAAEYYRRVLQDPVLLKRCRAIAKQRKIPLPAAAAAEFFKAGRATRSGEP